MESYKLLLTLVSLLLLNMGNSFSQTSSKVSSINIAGYTSGKIPKSKLLQASEMSISNEDLGKVESFMLVVVAKMGYEEPVKGKDFSEPCYSAFKATKAGSLILVDRVQLKRKDGTIVSHPELTLKLQVE